MSKFKKSGVLLIADNECKWTVQRLGGVSNLFEEHHGLSVSISVEPGRTRELVIEFPFQTYHFQPPADQGEFEKRLRAAIEAAMEAGWRPVSRGKAFQFAVPTPEDSMPTTLSSAKKRR